MCPQIVTLTMNPAVDLASTAASIRPTHKIRTFDERLDPGGGGINVARVLHHLGAEVRAVILTGGVTGRLVEELLDAEGVPWTSVPTRGRTRISVNVHDRQTGLEYRFVPEGPTVEPEEWQAVLEILRRVEAEWIIASGSLPRGVPADFYAQAAEIAAGRGQKFALDTSGEALRAAVAHGVELLKLSQGELAFLVGHDQPDPQAQDSEIAALLRKGAARMIAVTLGRAGAVLATREASSRMPALDVPMLSTVGAGDSFLAGLVLGLSRGITPFQALALGSAAGAAAVTRYGTALAHQADVETFYERLCGKQEVVKLFGT